MRHGESFDHDKFIFEHFCFLFSKHKIKTIIETGTNYGRTARDLAQFPAQFITIDIDEVYYDKSSFLDIHSNVKRYLGSSPEILDQILDKVELPVIFYLDAHWDEYCPLVDELKAIVKHQIKPVILIHDFKVPDRPDLGYDSYNNQDYEWEWIESFIKSIYGDSGYSYHYNDEAVGARRGIIYIEPKC